MPASGSWRGVTPDHYVTGSGGNRAECVRLRDGWFAKCGGRARGPLSSLDAAMTVADRMLDTAAKAS